MIYPVYRYLPMFLCEQWVLGMTTHFDTNLSEKTDKYFSQSELLTDYPV